MDLWFGQHRDECATFFYILEHVTARLDTRIGIWGGLLLLVRVLAHRFPFSLNLFLLLREGDRNIDCV